MLQKYQVFFLFFMSCSAFGQQIDLYSQYNGHYDYTAIGNTLNSAENNFTDDTNCSILTSSSANLNLTTSQSITAAYLYWAGSGIGDFDVELNNQPISADRTFSHTLVSNTGSFDFFSAFADVTSFVTSTGNGTYTLSELDLSNIINPNYCSNATNFGGWAIILIYEDSSLPLNQLSVYDGLQGVSAFNGSLTINLNNLNVIDNEGAKIGFLAWEGDANLAVTETLKVNGNTISNPPLNPANNAFNGTNSFTGSNNLYNMDLDYYDVEDNINIGDTSALIELSSGQDLIMINNVITVFNTTLPDPSPVLDQVTTNCSSRDILVDYTITNLNSTEDLPANTLVHFYADGTLVGQTSTSTIIPIGGSENGQISLTIPNNIPDDFVLQVVVNTDTNGNIVLNEINEDNNTDEINVQLILPDITTAPIDLEQCDDTSNDGIGTFDFSENTDLIIGDQVDVNISYHTSLTEAQNDLNPISDTTHFQNTIVPQLIYVRLESSLDPDCFVTDSFMLDVFYTPVTGNPQNLEVCDDSTNDETALFDLSVNSPFIIDNQAGTSLYYFLSAEDAHNHTNAIKDISNFENTSNPQQIYAKLINTAHPECYTLTDFEVTINPISTFPVEENLLNCNEGFGSAVFDLTEIESAISLSPSEEISAYYTSAEEASFSSNPINIPSSYQSQTNPQEIFIRVESSTGCYSLYAFEISTENCPPFIPQGFSPNGDGINDTFEISGLYNIFVDFELQIFSRYGNLVYEANNNIPAWDGTSNKGLTNQGHQLPTGTYYYILNLNDPGYSVYKSWVYLNR